MASMRAGIVHQPHGQTNLQCLPLEEVMLKAWVVDVSSRIILTQTFHNLSDEPTGRAKYVFPLPASAAVCAFELELEGGFVIIGRVKEKEEAARMFSNALNHGKTAALVERVTDDIFTISVGSIPAATRVIARLTFVMDLLDEGLRDHVRLQIPMHIAERYGTPPEALNDASAASSKTRVHINVDIQSSDVIYHIGCPTHEGVAYRRYKHAGEKSQRRMSAVWKSSEFLTTDFVLTIYAEGLDKPRCFAEALEYGDEAGFTIAMQLTLVPKFFAPKVPSQEYIFIIDRSGSMSNAPIETAKRTLTMLLRLLPSSQTTFNIFSFGSSVVNLWPKSHILDLNTLSAATAHVASMNADLGGTEIPMALQTALSSRGLDRPTVVFLLTDGQVNMNGALNPCAVIGNAVRNSPPSAPVRLFVLGIGAGVSSDVCSSLARQGNGEYMFAQSAENIVGKCARLLNAGRSKNIERIDIKWGDDGPSSSPQVNFAPPTIPEGIVALEPPPPIQQAPHTLTRIFSGIRFTVFAITSFKTMPTFVKLTTKLEGVAEAQELKVKVTKVKPFHGVDQDSVIPMVHTLAARKLIMELGDGVGPLPTPTAGDALLANEDDLRKAGIVRLGLTYQLVSKHTSFIADEEPARSMRRKRSGGWARSRLQKADASTDTIGTEDVRPAPTAPAFLDGFIDSVASFVTSVFGFLVGTANTMSSSRPQRQPMHSQSISSADEGGHGRRGDRWLDLARSGSSLSFHSVKSVSTLSSLDGSTSCSDCWTPSRSPSPQPRYQDPIERAPSPSFLREGGNQNNSALHPVNTKRPVPISQEVYSLFREVDLDGSYSATPLLVGLVGDAVLAKGDERGIDKKVWATAVVMAYMQKHLQGEPDLLDLMVDKSREFIQSMDAGRGNGSRNRVKEFEQMVREAVQLLGY